MALDSTIFILILMLLVMVVQIHLKEMDVLLMTGK
uniref:Uncharacterized protein n=2 Tax=Viruses TaxID=10239 RepID=A0A8D9PF11_9VIRU|nr:MAG TPA: hypothetical protein [Bacteriophage sp.]DAE13278.1 MAG TPA: hypothetical protein [Siphoviridae sp. ctLqe90]